MRARVAGVATAAAAVAAIAMVRRRRRSVAGPGGTSSARSGWYGVTVNRDTDAVSPGGVLPAPLAALGDAIEVVVRPAPGDKGSELRARYRGAGGQADRDRAGRLRAALREAKQLIEVGEVLRVDPTPHGRRPNTPTGAVVEKMTARSGEEGTL